MRTLAQLAGIAVVALAGTAAQAAEFGPLMDVVHRTWPEKKHIGVVADYRRSEEAILALAREAGAGSTITVVDTRSAGQVEKAGHLLNNLVKPDYLVLLPEDSMVWDGSFSATRLLGQAARAGIPAIGTSAKAIRQGAVFAMGEGTGMELMVTDKVIGTVEVILPDKAHFLAREAWLDGKGMATISVVAGF